MVHCTVTRKILMSRMGDVQVLSVSGDVALESIDALRVKLEDALGSKGIAIIIDLSGTEMIDTTGVGLLRRALWECSVAEKALVIVPTETITRLLVRTKTNQGFSVAADIDEAIQLIERRHALVRQLVGEDLIDITNL